MISPGESRAQKKATSVLDSFYIRNPSEIDLIGILGYEGILLKTSKLGRCQGSLVRNGQTGIINIDSGIRDKRKRRFVIAHELGHWYLHRDKKLFACSEEDLSETSMRTDQIEKEANVFAAEFLLPTKLLKLECAAKSLSVELLTRISNLYNISLTATSLKILNSGIFDFALVYYSPTEIWGRSSDTFYKFFGKPIIPSRSLAEKHRRSTISDIQSCVSIAKEWFPNDFAVKPDLYLTETMIPMPNIGASLTYLWVAKIDL